MKTPIRFSRPAATVLLFVLLPFVVAFDFPDTTGVRAKISAGRGTYSLSSCSRSFQSEYVEENVALRATFATGSEETSLVKRLQPGQTTVGAYGNWVQEELRLVREDGDAPEGPVTPKEDNGASFGAYTQLDWRFIGVQVGGIYLSQWDTGEEIHTNKLLPTAEIRLGPEYLYGSAAFLASTPVQSGGGMVTGGLGGRKGNTRIWGGLSVLPARENSISLKLSQKIGPIYLGFAGQWALEASRYDVTHENGFSLGLDVPLSKAW